MTEETRMGQMTDENAEILAKHLEQLTADVSSLRAARTKREVQLIAVVPLALLAPTADREKWAAENEAAAERDPAYAEIWTELRGMLERWGRPTRPETGGP